MSRRSNRQTPRPRRSSAGAAPKPSPAAAPAKARDVAAATAGSSQVSAGTVARADLWLALLLAALTIALYWPVHTYDFVNYDDVDYVVQNAPVRAGLTPASVTWAFSALYVGFWIPLTWLSFMADAQLYGANAGGFHVTNVFLHVASTLLLFVLLTRATGRRWPSAFTACLFAIHPLHVESVAWVTERKDVLSTLFLLLTLASYGRYAARPAAGRYLLTLLVFVLGLMAKPMLTTVPLLLLVVDFWPLRRFSGLPPARLLLEKLPFLALAVAAGLLTMFAGNHIVAHAPLEGVAIGDRVASALESYALYLAKAVWPSGLAPLYPDLVPTPAWSAVLAALSLAAITAVALAMRARRPYLIAGWLWYVVALVPVSGLVKIGPFTMADRFTYVPLIGIFAIAGWGLTELAIAQRALALALAAVALVGSLAVARRQIEYWRDSVTLIERTIAVTGDNPVAQYLLGLALADQGRTDEAIARYQEVVRIKPDYAHPRASLGQLLFEQGKVDDAIAQYDAALRADPSDAYAHAGLADALQQGGRLDDAISHYAEALRVDPGLSGARNGYGRALAAEGRKAEAAAQYAEVLRQTPENAEGHNNLANVLAEQGRADEAVAHYKAALRVRPGYTAARVNLAILLAEHGRFAEAAEHYAAALRARPDDAHLQGDFGNVLAAQGKLDEAVAHYGEALRIDPDSVSLHNNLGNALALLGRADEAIAQSREALRLDPRYAEAHYNLGIMLLDRGRAGEASGEFSEALRIKPTYAAAHTQLGIALRNQGRPSEAGPQFAEALRLDPSDATAERELAALRAPAP